MFFLRHWNSRVKVFFCEKFAWNARAGERLAVSWTLCQFSRVSGSDILALPKPPKNQGAAMNQLIDWIQNNWYEFGSLTAQLTIAFVVLSFASKILKTMRASQQQIGALLRLSMTNGLEERATEVEAAPRQAPSVVASSMFSPVEERPTPSPSAPRTAPARSSPSYSAFEKPARNEAPSLSEELSGQVRASVPVASAATATIEPTYDPTPYVAAPLTMPEDERNSSGTAAAGQGVVEWLQTPMASKKAKKKGPSPLRKVVRWLQAPVRS